MEEKKMKEQKEQEEAEAALKAEAEAKQLELDLAAKKKLASDLERMEVEAGNLDLDAELAMLEETAGKSVPSLRRRPKTRKFPRKERRRARKPAAEERLTSFLNLMGKTKKGRNAESQLSMELWANSKSLRAKTKT